MLESTSKLMYYPTDCHEIYRMLGIVGRIQMSIEAREEVRNMVGEETYFKILESSVKNSNSNLAVGFYHYFLENKQYDLISRYLELNIGYSNNQTVTVFDPFAGEGVWLEMFKQAIPKDEINSANIHTIANELESNRYNSIVSKNIVDEVYNKAYEELNNIPKGSISMLLYNPPYGDTNGTRNVYHYLKMIIDEEIIHRSSDYNGGGKIILVIRKDDLLDSLPLLVEHFDIDNNIIYQVNEEEYKKYKQYVVYGTLRNEPLDLKNTNNAIRYQKEINSLKEIINSNPQFNSTMYNTNLMRPPSVPYERLKENHKLIQEENFEISHSNGDVWDWFKELTEIKQIEHTKINKATPMKTGELSNLIASGMINGEMKLNDNEGYHIVAGGMKEQVKQEVVQELNRKNEVENKTKTVVYSQPYLNILINDNGKVKIKELEGGSLE